MGTSLTNVAGGIARLLLSVAVLFFNWPRLLEPSASTHAAAMEHVDTRRDGDGSAGFHATVTIGRGNRQVTVRLEFGDAREHAEESL